MPSTIEQIKSFTSRLSMPVISRRLNFISSRTSGGGSYAVSGSPQRGFTATSVTGDYEYSNADVLDNSVVAACVNAIAQALPEAPIFLEKRVGGNEFERVESHPVLDLLRNPNPYLSEAELWGITTAFERTRGEAFWYFEYEQGGTVPKEIWFRAPQFVQVLSDAEHFISGYTIMAESGQIVTLDEGDVVHFRHQLSAVNPRVGWTPLQTGRRQIAGDNAASLYHSAILRNAGAASLIISLKDAAAAGEVTPGQLDEYVQQFKRKTSGAGAGAILGMDLPLDVHKVGFSPDEMALDKLLEHYESRLCALLGVNRRVINLGQDPTYENSRVALKDFWQRTIIPMRRRHAATLSSQLLPLFGLDPALFRLSFDFSHIEALRDDVDALHARWRAAFVAGGVDLFTFQQQIGLTPDEAYRGRYAKPSSALDAGESDGEIKDVTRGKTTSNPHNTAGSFARGAGGVRAKLHQQHGVKREERGIEHGGGPLAIGRKEPVVVGLNNFDVTELVDQSLTNRTSQKRSAFSARNQLVEMYDDPTYQEQKRKVERLEKDIKIAKANLKENASQMSPHQRIQLDMEIALKAFDLDIERPELQKMHRNRFPQMWEILCANNNPVFNASDFAIYRSDFTHDENGNINKGINFFARMIDGHELPPTNDLKFRKGSQKRSEYLADGDDFLPENTVAIGTGKSAARPDVVVHEMAHWLIEKNPQLQQQLKWHFDRRTAGEPVLYLNQVNPQSDADEVYKKDEFVEPYMGKFYEDDQNEILTMGLQYFFLAPDVLAKKDPQTFDFIYKLMRGQNPEVDPATQRNKHVRRVYQPAQHQRERYQR